MYSALTIGGSDPSGGAGIQSDIKTFTCFGVYGLSVITSLTIQNTQGILDNYSVPPEIVASQLEVILDDIPIDTMKIGMLANGKTTKAITGVLKKTSIPHLIIDPIILSKNNYPMLDEETIDIFKNDLFYLAELVTPNLNEAAKLINTDIAGYEDMKRAAKKLNSMGAKAVLLKGGHLKSDHVIDLFYDGREFIPFEKERIKGKNPHGTGCALSAAICANLAKKNALKESISIAEDYINKAIAGAFSLGKGYEQLNFGIRD